MAGSTSSISSNEGRSGGKSKPVAAAGRGYQLTTSNTTTSGTGSQSSSRAQSPTPPPPNVMQHTNTTLTNSPAASSRNALGITHGWGVGLAHSGSYLATNVRTTSTIPLLTEEPDTFNAIKNILRQKQLLEQTQREMTKAKQLASKKNNNEATEQTEKTKAEDREAAVLQVAQGKERLQNLIQQRDELERNIRAQWEAKIDKFKEDSLHEEEQVLNELKTKHAKEIKQMTEDMMAQNKADEEELALKLGEMDEEKKRKLAGEDGERAASSVDNAELTVPSAPKRQKSNDSVKDDDAVDIKTEEASDLYDDLFDSPMKSIHKAEKEEESDHELFGDSDDNEADKPLSVQKSEELKKITDELKDLNKVKSQMVWLLKQVITAEAKMKMKQKLKAQADK